MGRREKKFSHSEPLKRRYRTRGAAFEDPHSAWLCVRGQTESSGDPPGQRSRSSRGRSAGVEAEGVTTSIECLYPPTRRERKVEKRRVGSWEMPSVHVLGLVQFLLKMLVWIAIRATV